MRRRDIRLFITINVNPGTNVSITMRTLTIQDSIINAEASLHRCLRRMNLLQERKLGHYQWRDLVLKMRQCRDNQRRQKNTIQRRNARAQLTDTDHIKYMDALRHRTVRSHLTNEQRQHIRMRDADRHRTARASLSDERRKQIRQKNALQQKLRRWDRAVYGKECQDRIVQSVFQHHRQECAKLGHCTADCNLREIYEYVNNEEEREFIRKARPECHFQWKYSNVH